MTSPPLTEPAPSAGRAAPVARLTQAQQRIRAAGLHDLLRVLADELHDLYGGGLVVVSTSDDGGQELVCREVSGRTGPQAPVVGDRVPVRSTLAGAALTCGRSLLCRDGRDDPRSAPERNRRFGIGSSMAVPVSCDGEVVGVVSVLAGEYGRFGDEDLAVAELTCGTASDRLTRLLSSGAGDEELHRTVLDALDDAVLVTRGEDLELVHANHALRRITAGSVVPEVGTRLGQVPLALCDTTGRPVPAEEQPTAVAWRTGRGVRDVVLRLRGAGGPGVDRWLCITALPVRDPLSHRVLSVVTRLRDVTAERHDREQLDASRERLRAAQQVSGLAWWSYDVVADTHTWSEQMFAIAGLDPHGTAPDGAGFLALVHPADRPQSLASTCQAGVADGGEPGTRPHSRTEVIRLVRPDGSVRVVQCWSDREHGPDGSLVRVYGASMDVTDRETERDDAARATARSERLFRATFENAPSGMVVVSAAEGRRGTIVRANRALAELVGVPESDLVGRLALDFLVESDRDPGHAILARMAATGDDSGTSHRRVLRPDGSVRDVYVSSTVLSQDEEPSVLTHVVDVTLQHAHQRTLEQMALTDSMTGLANRVQLAAWIEHALAGPPERLALLLLDLDRFKNVNDSLGHDVGDQLLVQVARRLATDGAQRGWKVARLGGDEFVVLLEDVDAPQYPVQVAERVLSVVAQPYLLPSGHRIETTASVGVAVGGGPGPDGENLLRHADLALYAAKDAGRNRFAVCDGRLLEATKHRVRTEQMLRRGLDAGRLRVHLQPIVDLGSRDLLAMEALVRLDDPQEGLLLPARFIDVAEESGLVTELDRAVLAEAVRVVAGHPLAADPSVRVAVNLSSRTLAQPDLAEHLRDVLREHGVSGSRLILEVTESGLLADEPGLHRTLRALTDLGAHLAIDDFGTGYSALAYLTRFRMHELKIDRAFVSELADPAGVATATVRAIIQLAHAHGMRVTAEGVETEQQAALLRSMGCDSGQGWLFGRPAPAWE